MTGRGTKEKSRQEVGDKLSVCVLKVLPEVSTMPGLVTISIMKVVIKIF